MACSVCSPFLKKEKMADFVNSLLSSLLGSLAGALGAYWVAKKSVAHQVQSARELDREAHDRKLTLQFLQQADDYLGLSFRRDDECKTARQRAGRSLLTTALLVLSKEKVQFLATTIGKVERYHKGMRVITFTELRTYLDGLRGDLAQEKFGIELPSTLVDDSVASDSPPTTTPK